MKKSSFFASILVAFVFLAASSAEAYRLEKEWSKSFDTRDGVSFTLENTNGPVEIEGWEKDRVEVRARIKIKAPSKSSALRVAEKLGFDVESSPEEVTIRVKYPRIRLTRFLDIFRGDRHSVKVSFRVMVPARCNVTVKNVNGGIGVAGTRGEFYLETVNGGIEIDGVEGFGNAKTVNGSISCFVKEFPHGADLVLKGTNGSIKLWLPAELNAKIDAKCVNGAVRVKYPLIGDVELKRWRFRGKIGDGSGNIKLRTINGSIKVAPMEQVI